MKRLPTKLFQIIFFSDNIYLICLFVFFFYGFVSLFQMRNGASKLQARPCVSRVAGGDKCFPLGR